MAPRTNLEHDPMRQTRGPKLMIIALDGLEPTLVHRFVSSGDMPNLAALREGGRWGHLRSTLPYATFPAWTSFLTGVNPGSHGIFDFARMVRGTYDVEFVGGAIRRRPTFARIASDAGMRVASVGFPGTYPPEPLSGVVIGGFDSPVAVSIDASFVHPRALAKELEARFGRYVFADFSETSTSAPGWHRRAARQLMAGLRKRRAIAEYIAGLEPWDLFMVHFGESDTAAHHFWAFHDEGSPRRPSDFDPGLSDVLRQVYAELDISLGRLLRFAGPDTRVMIASDHGFGGSSDKVFHLNRWLAERGWLTFEHSASAGRSALGLATKVGMAMVPGRVQEKLWRMMGPLAGRAEGRRRFAGLDWAGTKMFSDELSYNPGVRLNLIGREPEGAVALEEVDGLVEALRDALMELKDPWTGERLVASVHTREELYSGPAIEDSVDVVIDLALDGDYSYNLLSSGGRPGPVFRRLAPHELLGQKGAGMNGTHRRQGFWLIHGSGVAGRRKRADMCDMAPTALSALSIEVPAWMEGKSHLEQGPQMTRVTTDSTTSANGTMPYTEAQQAIVEERLRRLGYL